jgi:protein-S-isoprenylcysteine O-methyltransferase Ste14
VPTPLRFAALAALALGLALMLWAMHVNPFFSSAMRIQKERGQHVVEAGPYRWVRHPGYAGGIPAMAASGLVLSSWLAAGFGILGALWLLRRTIVEDRMLRAELPGYADYARRVPSRLVPGLW